MTLENFANSSALNGKGNREEGMEWEKEEELEKSTIALHTTGIPLEQSTTEYLSHNAIASALAYLSDVWPHLPMTAAMREAWVDILCQLHPGELKPALAKDRGDKRFRPDPYPLLSTVLGLRAEAVAASRAEQTRADLEARRDTTPAGNEHVASVIAEARKVLGPTHRRTEQRHYTIPGVK
jgi:hypothetical protein